MEMYVFRHGESEANRSGIFAGWMAVALTELGREQARQLHDALLGQQFDRVYCSDLLRARETVGIALPDAELTIDTNLREISVGKLAGRTAAECELEYGPSLHEYHYARNFRPYGGENNDDMRARAALFMRRVEREESDRIAVFCHEGIAKSFLALVMDTPVYSHRATMSNCACSVFRYEKGAWKLVQWNIKP